MITIKTRLYIDDDYLDFKTDIEDEEMEGVDENEKEIFIGDYIRDEIEERYTFEWEYDV